MKNIIAFGLIFLPLLLNAELEVNIYHDEFEGSTTIGMWGNEIGIDTDFAYLDASVDCGCVKIIRADSSISYYLAICYVGDEWLFVNTENSLIILIDGERKALDVYGNINRDIFPNARVIEQPWYSVDETMLMQLYAAKEIKLRLVGDRLIDCYFTAENLEDFREFYELHINLSTLDTLVE